MARRTAAAAAHVIYQAQLWPGGTWVPGAPGVPHGSRAGLRTGRKLLEHQASVPLSPSEKPSEVDSDWVPSSPSLVPAAPTALFISFLQLVMISDCFYFVCGLLLPLDCKFVQGRGCVGLV